ncbi:MAG TPA: NAD(P)H-hydrate dehydratase [Candidatus Saccharimonadales bacterium]
MDQVLLQKLLHRSKTANKYDFGHVLIVGGSPGMVGAPLLSGRAALRVGAGLVTIAADPQTTSRLDRRVEELMTHSLPNFNKPEIVAEAVQDFVDAHKVRVVIIGPGLATSVFECVLSIAERLKLPMILDGGGLAAFVGKGSQLSRITQSNLQVILTPHTGEFAKLIGSTMPEHRKLAAVATEFAKSHKVTLVLKGYHTIVAHPDGSSYENRTGNPGLATAGTGDVLAGVIAGFLAQGVDVARAAEIGVYLHGLAGDLAAQAKTQPGVIASDVIELLPAALKKAADE